MATLSSPGVGSGLDVNSIVTQLVAIERQPIDALKTKATTIQTQLSSFGLLSSYTSNIRDIAAKLAQPSFWTGQTATSSDAASVGVSATASATSGSYAVEVATLAQAQGLASKAYTDPTGIGTGSLHIELGAWDSGLTTFKPDTTKTAIDVTIEPGEDSLASIKTKINAANAGVTASIVTDASGARLVLRSNATGAASAVRITATDADTNNADAIGLSALAFDPPTHPGQMSQSQPAKDAQATINGLPVSSSTNTLTGVLDGVTLTLTKVTTSPVTVGVSLDTGTLKKAITDFAKAYSDMNGYIKTQTKYDPATKKAATLQGDRATLTLQSNLRGVFLGGSSASPVFGTLSSIGVQIQTDGSLKVDDAKLTAALANPTEVAKLFSSTVSADPDQQGFAVRVKTMADRMIGSSGAITSRTQSLRDSINRNSNDQQKLEDRVALTKARLLKQYNALDTQLGQISGTGSSLTQSLAALTNLSTAIANGR
jgi:flagellar hook-associated protein 2